jgi:L-Ala-D/L-Glu epimerase
MKIKSVKAYLERLPLVQPYTIAYQTITDTEIIYFEVTLDNGITGFGAANPFPEVIGETPALTLQHLQSDYVQDLVGRNIDDYSTIIDDCNLHFAHLPGTQAAIDIALHDTYCKLYNKSVIDLYGTKIKSLPTSVTIGIKPIAEMLVDAEQFYAKGFRILKIKTGVNVDEDIECIAKLSEQFGKQMRMRVDANLGYDFNQLQHFIAATAKYPIELIEQPLPVGAENRLAMLPKSIREKLVADESLTDLNSAISLCQQPQPYGVFNIKLMKAGGIKGAKAIADIALQNNIHLFWGCNDESLISITAALHIAFACSNTKYLDLDGSLDVMEQAFKGGFVIKNGEMMIGEGVGLGVERGG